MSEHPAVTKESAAPEREARKIVEGCYRGDRLSPERLIESISSALAAAEARGAERERERVTEWATDYAEECERCLREEEMPEAERQSVQGKLFLARLIVERSRAAAAPVPHGEE